MAEHPLRERLHGQLILGALPGRPPGGCVGGLPACARDAGEELGLDPSPELQELHRLILNQDEALAAPERTAARADRAACRPRPPPCSGGSGSWPS